ncbi:Adenylosuccinate synthetase [Caldithrix abyssi DSM 13497]|uniref:Adenylosuccinate synthetase n=1 Tax=Caldithrix abyssi DSM 13497 TaxID=880073 RepID=H1XQD3_CALAY|nr:adenylosuccinate synthase [Caldithrix abyssi]APF19927.1 purA Adenylosuccinate synthetase [Caldithrix abyssi DSM 13497]EHO40020.1 Adenylosuccinate synthetase [Caldithrix abyssi DSM 13497]
MANYIILGAQWGDEGKGKIVDLLASHADLVVRFQGGANAGHTVIVGDKKFVLHLIPGGIVSGKAMNVIGNGCVVDPITFKQEIEYLKKQGIDVTPDKLMISFQAHVVTPVHKYLDRVLNKKIGTTGRGIGPAYTDKIQRTGVRLEAIVNGTFLEHFKQQAKLYEQYAQNLYKEPFLNIEQAVEELKEAETYIRPFIGDTVELIHTYLEKQANILYEGAQGAMLDVDHGTYPFVTSSSTTIGGAFTGGGVFLEFDKRIGLVKAYTTRVGEGPFPTELNDETGEKLRKKGHEFGATTGRPRRCGWLDLKLVKRAQIINGFNYITLSKLSCLSGFETIKIAVDYDSAGQPVYRSFPGWEQEIEGVTEWQDLPQNAREYVRFIEDYLQTPIGLVSTGPDRNHVIYRQPLW